jgi:mono/diheme cytochrome c family protein
MKRIWHGLTGFLAVIGLAGCSPMAANSTTPPAQPGTAGVAVSDTNGLQGSERDRFHHLAEGSEFFPLPWLLALHDPTTDKPFMDNPERFGLIADKASDENPYGLPIGITADYTRDLRFAGLKMVGVNCAACHVNDLYYHDVRVARIDGAPNLFDLQLFYEQLAKASLATIGNPARAWQFAVRLYHIEQPQTHETLFAALPEAAKVVADEFPDLSTLRNGDAAQKAFARQIETAYQEEMKRPVINLEAKFGAARQSQPFIEYREWTEKQDPKKAPPPPTVFREKARDLRTQVLGSIVPVDVSAFADVAARENSAFAKLSVPARKLALTDSLSHFIETLRLLRARVEFLASLLGSQNVASTRPGFGRVDAFDSARNIMFRNSPVARTAPVSYPHLWNLSQIQFFHWDANTNSLLERNVGQAIGLGAIYSPTTFESTVLIANLTELENLARKITPPPWPAAFPPIDANKANNGKAIWEARCAKCHQSVPSGQPFPDSGMDLIDIQTDPLRATNFAIRVGNQDFADALKQILDNVTQKAGGQPGNSRWRTTTQYANRPLIATWATAPYLHNNSVPTLYDLLLPANQRPVTFVVGPREYDPVKLGYSAQGGSPQFLFDTREAGNSNGGHSGLMFGTDLTEPQRMDLLEYLKTR